MTARQLRYWDLDPTETLRCGGCSWSGPAADAAQELFSELIDVRCPRCDAGLVLLSFPTLVETRAAAAGGNPRAIAELPEAEAQEARARAAARSRLVWPDQLPELDGEDLVLQWDFEERDGESWTLLRHGDVVLWRELAYYEGNWRFEEVLDLLVARYGSRLARLDPTPASEMYLYGDQLSAPKDIEALNRRLRS